MVNPITIYTDQKVLDSLQRSRRLNGKLARWALQLQNVKSQNADYLSWQTWDNKNYLPRALDKKEDNVEGTANVTTRVVVSIFINKHMTSVATGTFCQHH